jgi:Protein of unknown function (DUF2938)
MNLVFCTVVLGLGATALMDLWGLARQPLLRIPSPDYAPVGRWLAHMAHGRFRHASIAAAAPVRYERLLGWTAHYLIGIAFAAVLVAVAGHGWLRQPTLAPALLTGLATVSAPFLLMQPAMGAGIAASRTPRPRVARTQSLVTHAVFGLGLYLTGWALRTLATA